MQHTAVLVVVVAAIALNERWLGKRADALAANRRDRLDQRDSCVMSLRLAPVRITASV